MRLAIVLVALAAALPFVPASSAAATVGDYDIVVDGEPAHGLLGVPAGPPTTLVVVTHGWTHTAESHRGHLQTLADRGFLAVAMDFRGSGFPIRAGADDTAAAIEDLLATYDSVDEVVMFSVSMGAAVGALVIAENPNVVSSWFLSEPMANLAETYAEASAVCPLAAFACQPRDQIEEECVRYFDFPLPMCLARRTAVLRVPEFVGLESSIVAHGVNDGLVPHNQGREVAAALRAHGVATDFYTVLRGEEGGEGTTITGHAEQNIDGWAGHGTESNDDHTLTRVSWNLFLRWLDGEAGLAPRNYEYVWDRQSEIVPRPDQLP